jgi:hypothetical protein
MNWFEVYTLTSVFVSGFFVGMNLEAENHEYYGSREVFGLDYLLTVGLCTLVAWLPVVIILLVAKIYLLLSKKIKFNHVRVEK